MQRPNLICLMPIKNEAWILERSLKCNSLWADRIIIADQSDNDECKKIAEKFSNVTYLRNTSSDYSEYERQSLLLEEARRIPKPRLLFSLDADEVFTANLFDSNEWQTVLQQPEGTLVYFTRVEIRPDLERYWLTNETGFPRAYIDDGKEITTGLIHTALLPWNPQMPWLMLKEIKLLHYQFAEWRRMESKHRWYLCLERLFNNPGGNPVDVFREYSHMYSVHAQDIKPLNPVWFKKYQENGIDMTSINKTGTYWFDRDVIKWFDEYGTKKFSRDAIWDVDWTTLARQCGLDVKPDQYKDPRNVIQRAVHKWLRSTRHRNNDPFVKYIDSLLKKIYR